MTNLLPPNSTAHEKAMHAAVMSQMPADRFDEISTYKDPQTCPEYLLPYLAWECGVDEWDSNWSTQTKRDVIEAAPEEQAHGGTVYAIKKGLASLGFGLTLKEGWETDDLPHSFQVFASLNNLSGLVLDAEAIKLIHRKIKRAKNVRSQYDLQFGIGFSNPINIGTAFAASGFTNKKFRAEQTPIKNQSGFILGMATRAAAFIQATFNPTGEAIPSNAITHGNEPITYNNEYLVYTN